jgi:hypothetical protein
LLRSLRQSRNCIILLRWSRDDRLPSSSTSVNCILHWRLCALQDTSLSIGGLFFPCSILRYPFAFCNNNLEGFTVASDHLPFSIIRLNLTNRFEIPFAEPYYYCNHDTDEASLSSCAGLVIGR